MACPAGAIACTACSSAMVRRGDMEWCVACGAPYPVVSGIPVLFGDLRAYLAERHSVGAQMMRSCGGDAREMVAAAMPADAGRDSRGASERRWAAIYQSGADSGMYRHVLDAAPPVSGHTVLEHGCSVGTFSRLLRDEGAEVTGVDSSFPALSMAARQNRDIRYVAADSASLSCGMFDVVVSLNMLEIVEPRTLLGAMASRATRRVVVADPYDYPRGDRTVSGPMGGAAVRGLLRSMGFEMVAGTESPSFIPWEIYTFNSAFIGSACMSMREAHQGGHRAGERRLAA